MRKILLVLFAVALIVGVGKVFSASTDISIEPLVNDIYDSTYRTIRIELGRDSGVLLDVRNTVTVAAITTSISYDTPGDARSIIGAANASRRYYRVQNISDSAVWVALRASADSWHSATASLLLGASGDFHDSWAMPTGAIYTGEISAIDYVAGHTGRLLVLEY